MSGFEAYLRSSLAGVNPKWAQEFDALIRDEDVQNALDDLHGLGGEPNFALFVVTHLRWRRIKALPARRERDQLLRAIRLVLEGTGVWSDRLHEFRRSDWPMVEEVLRTSATYLESFHPVDEA